MSARFWLVVAVLCVTLPAHAEVKIDGDAASLKVEAKDAKISEVMKALGAFNVKLRMPRQLDRPVSGSYSGRLREVLTRILDQQNYNFIIGPAPSNGLDVMVLDIKGPAPDRANSEGAPRRPNRATPRKPPPESSDDDSDSDNNDNNSNDNANQ